VCVCVCVCVKVECVTCVFYIQDLYHHTQEEVPSSATSIFSSPSTSLVFITLKRMCLHTNVIIPQACSELVSTLCAKE
jgi:hypothetical protein